MNVDKIKLESQVKYLTDILSEIKYDLDIITKKSVSNSHMIETVLKKVRK